MVDLYSLAESVVGKISKDLVLLKSIKYKNIFENLMTFIPWNLCRLMNQTLKTVLPILILCLFINSNLNQLKSIFLAHLCERKILLNVVTKPKWNEQICGSFTYIWPWLMKYIINHLIPVCVIIIITVSYVCMGTIYQCKTTVSCLQCSRSHTVDVYKYLDRISNVLILLILNLRLNIKWREHTSNDFAITNIHI